MKELTRDTATVARSGHASVRAIFADAGTLGGVGIAHKRLIVAGRDCYTKQNSLQLVRPVAIQGGHQERPVDRMREESRTGASSAGTFGKALTVAVVVARMVYSAAGLEQIERVDPTRKSARVVEGK